VTSTSAQRDAAATDRLRHPDPSFPRLHGRPSRGWLNDPHGCIQIDGRYHVFFQHNPDRPYHEQMHWGHMSSTDLAHWDNEPIALFNRPGELDEFGCWTGSLIDDGGTPTIAYSAVANASEDAAVLLARSDREMRTWCQDTEPVCGLPEDPAVTHARDPFVFEFEGHRYAVQGAGSYAGPGAARVLVYSCDDLTSWTELGPLVSAAEDDVAASLAPADVWECPNLFPLGDRWVLIVSLWSRTDREIIAKDVRYLVGDLQLTADGPRFQTTSGGAPDRGPTFYAPQILREPERTLIWGWSREHGRPQEEVDAAGWAGTLTFCRQLRLHGGRLISEPVPELEKLRQEAVQLQPEIPFEASAFDVRLGLGAGVASLWLIEDGRDSLVVEFEVSDVSLTQPRILVDGSIIEIFDGSGVPYTTRAYPTKTSTWKLRLEHPVEVFAWTLEA
jgi:beta-fructofuranosidase